MLSSVAVDLLLLEIDCDPVWLVEPTWPINQRMEVSLFLLEDIVDAVLSRTAEVPPSTQRRAGICALDAVGCSFGGFDLPWSVAARATSSAVGPATVWGQTARRSVLDAVYANGVMAHSIVQEDMHPASRSHMGTVVVPAAIAVAETVDIGGDTLARAIVAGYETMAYIGELLTTERFIDKGFRPTGYLGPFGAAMAASVVLGLPRDVTVSALALAGSAAAGTCSWAYAGTADCFFQNGTAARAGVHATLLAANGIQGARSLLEGPAGLLAVFDAPHHHSLARREALAVDECYFKAYPSCAFTQEAIRAAKILRARGTMADAITSVAVRTYRMGKQYPGCDNSTDLGTSLARQMSCQFGMAAMFIEGEVSLAHLTGEVPPSIGQLASLIELEEDAAATGQYPAERIVEVCVSLADGSEQTVRVDDSVELTEEEVVEKFRRYSADRLNGAASSTVVDALQDVTAIDKVSALTGALRPSV